MKIILLTALMFFSAFSHAQALTIHYNSITITMTDISQVQYFNGLQPLLDAQGDYELFTDEEVKVIDNLRHHTVLITTQSGKTFYRGTGIAIDSRHILTAYHVVNLSDSKSFYFANENVKSQWVTVEKYDESKDLALLIIGSGAPDLIAEPIPLADTVQPHEQIMTIGHPYPKVFQLSSGKVIGNAIGANDVPSVQLDMILNGGNSGGGVINTKGELVGIADAKALQIGNISYMIGIEDIKEFLQ